MRRRRRGICGFTLIELMIVVAIIGILSAIAIPNFLKFQAKSKQAEARANLGGIYVAQLAYFSTMSTYGTFTEIGFVSSDAAARYYTYTDGVEVQVGKIGLTPCPDGSVTAAFTATGFTATAVGSISNVGIDCWYVNDQKTVFNWNPGY